MSDLAEQFAAAAAAVQNLPEKPSNDDLLNLYALYKQGSTGDAGGDRPGMMDFVGRAKYDAWAKVRGMDRDEAMRAYIEMVESLKSQ